MAWTFMEFVVGRGRGPACSAVQYTFERTEQTLPTPYYTAVHYIFAGVFRDSDRSILYKRITIRCTLLILEILKR